MRIELGPDTICGTVLSYQKIESAVVLKFNTLETGEEPRHRENTRLYSHPPMMGARII